MAKITSHTKKVQKEELSEAPQVEELLKNLEFHKAIQNITSRIMAAESIADIVVNIKEDIRKLFDIHVLTIYLIDKTRKEIFTVLDDGRQYRFPINNATLAGYVAQRKKMVHISDAYNEREIRRLHETLTIDRSMDKKTGISTGQVIACPIMRDNLICGVMEIMIKKGGDKIDDYNQIFLDEITGVLAKALFAQLNFTEVKQTQGVKFESLIQKGILTSDQMDKAIKEVAETRNDLASILMERCNVSRESIASALSAYYACQFISYSEDIPIPRDLLIGIEKYTLTNMMWVPLKVVKGKIHVITDDPFNQTRRNKIEDILETRSIRYDVSIAADILQFIDRFYPSDKQGVRPLQTSDSPSPQKPFDPENIPLAQVKNEDENTVKSVQPETPVNLEPADEFSDDDSFAGIIKTKKSALSSDKISSSLAFRTEEPSKIEKEKFPDIDDLADIRRRVQSKPVVSASPADDQLPQPLTSIITEACGRRASDLHFEPDPQANHVTLRIRIDGQFSTLPSLTYPDYDTLTRQIKVLANLEEQNSSSIQNGKLSLKRPSGHDIHLRVSFIPTRTGMEDTVVHISSKLKKMPLELLGLSEKDYTDLINILRQPRGLILMTGPAHSGLTTTLHACLDNINTPGVKIWTAEEPIEIIQAGLRQVQIDAHKSFDFAGVIQSFLTADPDVIMSSRIDTPATAKLCMQAAIRGRLVLGSLWAESVPDAIEHCLEMQTGHLVFADAMLAIVQQRLIKTLCPKCKEKYHPSHEGYDELSEIYGKDAFEKLNIPYSNAFSLYRPKGCPDCNQTGYTGRMCVSETLIFTPEIKRMIRRKESPQRVYEAALTSGMTTLMQDGIIKVLQGHSDFRHVRLACLR